MRIFCEFFMAERVLLLTLDILSLHNRCWLLAGIGGVIIPRDRSRGTDGCWFLHVSFLLYQGHHQFPRRISLLAVRVSFASLHFFRRFFNKWTSQACEKYRRWANSQLTVFRTPETPYSLGWDAVGSYYQTLPLPFPLKRTFYCPDIWQSCSCW